MAKCKYETKNGRCGLKGSYAYRRKCYTEDFCRCHEPQTNADRIRAMSDEELAELFQSIIHERDVIMIEKLKNQGIEASLVEAPVLSVRAHLEWLKQPEEGE